MKLSERLKTDRYMTPDGRIVFTEGFLLKQGRCCGLGCLHCPYDPPHKAGNVNVAAKISALLECKKVGEHMKTTLKPIKPGLTDEALKSAEQHLGRALPDELRDLFLKADGAYVVPDWFVVEWPTPEGDLPELAQLATFYDISTLVKESRALAGRLPPGALVIGQDPGGSLLLMLTQGGDAGAIRFWRLAFDPYGEGDNVEGLGLVASSLEEMLASMEQEPTFE